MHFLTQKRRIVKAAGSVALVCAIGLGIHPAATKWAECNTGGTMRNTSSATVHHTIKHRFAQTSEGKSASALKLHETVDGEQYRDFTEQEMALVDMHLADMALKMRERGYELPEMDAIMLVKTAAPAEGDAPVRTDGSTIYVSERALKEDLAQNKGAKKPHALKKNLWRETLGCLKKASPDCKAEMGDLVRS